ncbi:GNAT family N-acetyltransferase [Gymnodinialimonas ceratoperidinii]|uniref:GNAT family N-acetyltransferase n=1 Tax=Gymnodinialimonas ceratoperidinii TaxID=2856823 RepID=A0A8F6Y8V3_9RHOB|nr:GNAT family N-acetyltransferase [Gymnodinialimonas ceratoperidinii]QXT38289.1 GNAT family N-acetyltransferase [Gymnodinialimonas ceratoperidinii]
MTQINVQVNPPVSPRPADIHKLLDTTYAYMNGRIDPPSFLVGMTTQDVARKMASEDFFLVQDGPRPVACGFGHGVEGAPGLYELGKLAVAGSHQRRGIARALIDTAADHARARGFATLQLFARVELTENHAVYEALGFTRSGSFTHPGFAAPTAHVFQRPL